MGLFDRLRREDGPRVAFIGIDGVPHSLVVENPDVFQNLTAISRQGSSGSIRSIVPPESSACWPSITTGKNPGSTGVYGFQERKIGSHETYIPMGEDVKSKRVWELIAEIGKKATVMNVPVTYPPRGGVQRMVSGFLSTSVESAAKPQEVKEYLMSMGYRIDVDSRLGHEEDKTAFLQDALFTLEKRFEAFEYFIEKDDWDLFFGVFMTTDRVNHFLYGDYKQGGEYFEEFLEFYRILDEYMGKLKEMLAEDVTMMIASDHGFTELIYEFHANEWLQRLGWVKYRENRKNSLEDVSLGSKAYSLIPGRFYINLKGREPNGEIKLEDYENVREELKGMLLEIEGPEGGKVIKSVEKCEDVFTGDHVGIAPDLVALPNDGFDLKAGFGEMEDVFGKGPRNGMHTFENALLIIDRPGMEIEGSNLYNIAPTILGLMGIEHDPAVFDGESLI
tara:strand:- start:4808 stop:6151 length:1344 start_codon:yes stop_codon:yes gene_type:complete